MNRVPTVLAILISLLLPLAATASVREFGPKIDYPNVGGYAEVEYLATHRGRAPVHFSHRVWFNAQGDYRVESSGVLDQSTREVRLGSHIYAQPFGRAWHGYPAAWFPNQLGSYLIRHIELTGARLIGRESLLGLPAEHWCGRPPGSRSRGVLHVWVSTDPRFPLVLRTESWSPKGSGVWQITKLDLTTPVPSCVFTARTHPRAGLWTMLTLPYRSLPMTAIWYALILACYAGVMLTLAPAKHPRAHTIAGIASSLGVLLLLFISPKLDTYFYQLSDTPVLLGLAALALGSLALVWRKTGPPGGARLFAGTDWRVIVYVAVAAALGVVWQSAHWRPFISDLGLHDWRLPLLPATLLNIALYAIAWAAVEEVVFRGYLYSALARRFQSAWIVIGLQGLLFVISHVPKELASHGLGRKMVGNLIGIAVFGVIFGLLRRKYNNLAAPFLVHLAYNTAGFYVGCTTTSGSLNGLIQMLR